MHNWQNAMQSSQLEDEQERLCRGGGGGAKRVAVVATATQARQN